MKHLPKPMYTSKWFRNITIKKIIYNRLNHKIKKYFGKKKYVCISMLEDIKIKSFLKEGIRHYKGFLMFKMIIGDY